MKLLIDDGAGGEGVDGIVADEHGAGVAVEFDALVDDVGELEGDGVSVDLEGARAAVAHARLARPVHLLHVEPRFQCVRVLP